MSTEQELTGDIATRTPSSQYLDAVGALLSLHRRLRTYSKSRSASGLSGRRVAVLRYLRDTGQQTVGDLARYLFISEAATSELLGKLKSDGLIVRQRSDQDNRIVFVSLTPLGESTADETPLGGIPLLRERMKDLAADELTQIATTMSRLVELLDHDDRETSNE